MSGSMLLHIFLISTMAFSPVQQRLWPVEVGQEKEKEKEKNYRCRMDLSKRLMKQEGGPGK
eukprot:205717-Karenia_brevis.AAC.1